MTVKHHIPVQIFIGADPGIWFHLLLLLSLRIKGETENQDLVDLLEMWFRKETDEPGQRCALYPCVILV